MASEVISRKLESLRRCLARLRAKRPEQVGQLLADVDLQDILALNLERAVQMAVDIAAVRTSEPGLPPPETMAESFERLQQHEALSADTAARMRRAVGFRNVAVHSYQDIRWEIVFSLLQHHLDDFEAFAREICAEAR